MKNDNRRTAGLKNILSLRLKFGCKKVMTDYVNE